MNKVNKSSSLSFVLQAGMAILICLNMNNGFAWSWQDLWWTPDQQAAELMAQGAFKEAQNLFVDPAWQASAAYRAENYEQAARLFGDLHTVEGYYNQGNALAHLNKLQQAIDAYNKALAIEPQHADALYNRQLVEALLKNQQQTKNQQPSSESKSSSQTQNDSKGQGAGTTSSEKDKEASNSKNADKASEQGEENSQKTNTGSQEKAAEASAQNNAQKKEDKQQAETAQTNKVKNMPKTLNPTNDTQKTSTKAATKGQNVPQHEKDQAKEQWLRLIPDDPGGLLREKFLRDYLRKKNGDDE